MGKMVQQLIALSSGPSTHIKARCAYRAASKDSSMGRGGRRITALAVHKPNCRFSERPCLGEESVTAQLTRTLKVCLWPPNMYVCIHA